MLIIGKFTAAWYVHVYIGCLYVSKVYWNGVDMHLQCTLLLYSKFKSWFDGMFQTRFFNIVDNLPQPENDTDKLIHSVIRTEREFFKYYLSGHVLV